jgi:hypothetical protein
MQIFVHLFKLKTILSVLKINRTKSKNTPYKRNPITSLTISSVSIPFFVEDAKKNINDKENSLKSAL